MIKYKLIDKGTKADIFSRVNKESVVFNDFLLCLSKVDQSNLLNLIEMVKKLGVINNPQKYEVISKSEVVELKLKKTPYRLLAHRIKHADNRYKYIILICFKKNKKKKQSREINKAKDISSQIIAGNGVEI